MTVGFKLILVLREEFDVMLALLPKQTGEILSAENRDSDQGRTVLDFELSRRNPAPVALTDVSLSRDELLAGGQSADNPMRLSGSLNCERYRFSFRKIRE